MKSANFLFYLYQWKMLIDKATIKIEDVKNKYILSSSVSLDVRS